MRLSEYAFSEHGNDAKIYNGIYDLEAENARLRESLEALWTEVTKYNIGYEGSELLEVMSDARAILAIGPDAQQDAAMINDEAYKRVKQIAKETGWLAIEQKVNAHGR